MHLRAHWNMPHFFKSMTMHVSIIQSTTDETSKNRCACLNVLDNNRICYQSFCWPRLYYVPHIVENFVDIIYLNSKEINKPKNSSFKIYKPNELLLTKMFSGLMSLWVKPCECRCSTAEPISSMNLSVNSLPCPRLPLPRKTLRLPPAMNSITIASWFWIVMHSITSTILGCFASLQTSITLDIITHLPAAGENLSFQ